MLNQTSTRSSMDWMAVFYFVVLVLFGWMNVFSASYSEDAGFVLGTRYGMQMIWIVVAFLFVLFISFFQARLLYFLSWPIYILVIGLVIVTLFAGKEVNGSRSWLYIGGVGIQSAEFAKLATALLLARIVSSPHFRIVQMSHFLAASAVIALPVCLILLQNETGSALVFASFLIVYYRLGFPAWIVVAMLGMVVLFIMSLMLDVSTIIIFVSLVCAGVYWSARKKAKEILVALALIAGITVLAMKLADAFQWAWLGLEEALLVSHALVFVFATVMSYVKKIPFVKRTLLLFSIAVGFCFSVEFVFHSVLQEHQRRRINDLLGIEQDLQGWGYNAYQSKIAIGSGGFLGKGFMKGTQTKYNFVPEQSTDFIFCTVGEEWGFVGSAGVVLLFSLLLLRIARIAERQTDPFARYYGYCVVGILLFHLVINVGMTIGIMPVIGIPLPFFSYGGSSLWAFTILLFIFLRLDALRGE